VIVEQLLAERCEMEQNLSLPPPWAGLWRPSDSQTADATEHQANASNQRGISMIAMLSLAVLG
jgi:hypothetical protein